MGPDWPRGSHQGDARGWACSGSCRPSGPRIHQGKPAAKVRCGRTVPAVLGCFCVCAGLIPTVTVLMAHVDHDAKHFWSAHNRREDGARSIARLDHTNAEGAAECEKRLAPLNNVAPKLLSQGGRGLRRTTFPRRR